MGVIIKGHEIEVPDLEVQNFVKEPKFGLKPVDGRARPNTWVRGIVLHTTKGIPGGRDRRPQKIKPGLGPNHERDEKVAIMWSLDSRKAGAHLIVDSDGSWVNTCDLQLFAPFHAGKVNNVTIGIEIYQEGDGGLYEGQLESVVKMVDFLTLAFTIQRQFHSPYKRRAISRGLKRGADLIGIYGHRDCSNNRGEGDPGDEVFKFLAAAGYEAFDFGLEEDRYTWKERQQLYNLLPDGIPGPLTARTLREEGHDYGLWVARPSDAEADFLLF